MRFLDLIVSDERSALARLDHVDVAELKRRFCRVVCRLMLQAQCGYLRFKPRQVLEKLFDDTRIEMDSRAAQQERRCFVERHTAPERPVFTERIEAIDYGNDAG